MNRRNFLKKIGESVSGIYLSLGVNVTQWVGVDLPLVRRVFVETTVKEIVSVQPMNLPSGLIFYLDSEYGNTVSGCKKYE